MILKIFFIIGLIILCFNVLRFGTSAILFFFKEDKRVPNTAMKLLNALEAVIILTTLTLLIIGYYD